MSDKHVALLQRYCATGDAEAFAEIVRDYQDLVFSACVRVLGNAADAEDVSQECFLRLARDSAAVRTSVAGWLHRCAITMSIDELRRKAARRDREEVHSQMNGNTNHDHTWQDIAPLVDTAINELPDELRLVLVEHFLHRRTQAEIAEQLGMSAPTVSRRIDAGIEVLRKKLKKAGVVVSAVVLTTLIAENSVQAAPAALAAGLAKMAMAGPAAAPTAAAPLTAAPGAEASTASTLSTASIAASTAAPMAAGLLGAAWVKIAAVAVAAALVLGGGAAIMLPTPGVPFPWAEQRGWKAANIAPTTLEPRGIRKVIGQSWRNLPFDLGKDEEADVKTCVKLAQGIYGSTNGVTQFETDETRLALEAILARRPDWFYAEFLLGQWYQKKGDAATARELHERAWRHAPVVIVQQYTLADGKPLAGAGLQSCELECNRVRDGSLNPDLTLLYPDLRSDANGCIYLPAYDTVFRRYAMASPPGYYTDFPRLGWFTSPCKVGLLPVATVQAERNSGDVVLYSASCPGSRCSSHFSEQQPKGALNCGCGPRVGEYHIAWEPLGKSGRYRFELRFSGEDIAETWGNEVVYNGANVAVFADNAHQVLIFAPGSSVDTAPSWPPPIPPDIVLEYRVIPFSGTAEQAMNDLIKVIARRLDCFDRLPHHRTRKAAADQISVELWGLNGLDLARIRGLIEGIGSLEFRLVCSNDVLLKQAEAGNVPDGYHWYADRRNPAEKLLVNDSVELTGKYIYQTGIQRSQTGEREVKLEFNGDGTRIFAKLTRDNIMQRLAIILGDIRDANGKIIEQGQLYSAPVIRTEIRGSAVISGNFTQQEAEDLGSVLQGGALPAKLELVKQKIDFGVRVEKLAPLAVACIRHVGAYEGMPATWARLMAWAGQKQLLGANAVILGISYDDPKVTSAEKLRYDACIVVPQDTKPEGEVKIQQVAGGEYAIITYRGRLESTPAAVDKLILRR